MDQGDGVESALGQFFVDQFRKDGIAPLDLECFGLFAASFAHIEPLVGESAAHAVEDFFLHEIAQRAFHHAPSGGGGQINGSCRAEEGLQARVNGLVEGRELGAAVADLRVAESAESFVRNLNRSGDEKFDVAVGGGVGGIQHD